MNILGIDCSTKITSIGAGVDGVCKAEINLELAKRQSAELPLLVEKVLDESGLHLADLNLIAVGKGPGYYTGIRTGVAYAAALAEALNIKVVPLSTLEIFVYDLIEEDAQTLLAPVLKANRDHVYGAIYETRGDELQEICREGFYSAEEFAQELRLHKNALIVGADRDLYEPLAALPNEHLPRLSGFGRSIVELGARYWQYAEKPAALRGTYLREPDIGPC